MAAQGNLSHPGQPVNARQGPAALRATGSHKELPCKLDKLPEIKRNATYRKYAQHDKHNAYNALFNWGGGGG